MSKVAVQSLWVGDRLSQIEELAIRSFLAHGHEYRLYTYGPVENVPDGTTVLDGRDVSPKSAIFTYKDGFGKGSPAAFSNYFRYEVLHELGGWWVDADLVLLRPLEFNQPYVFSQEARRRKDRARINCAAICVPPRSEIMRWCLDYCDQVDFDMLRWSQIGPALLSAAVRQHGMESHVVPSVVFCPLRSNLIDRLFSRKLWRVPREAVAIHLWAGLLRERGEIDRIGGPGCLLEQLKIRYDMPQGRAT